MADRIIFKNTTQEANIESIQVTDVLNGEILVVRETNKEHLYCKNSNGEISKIHRITDCGGFPSSTTLSYEAIDLGLPSGLLWANKNIGAETEEDAGLYFQWGDTQGYTAEQVGVDKQFANDWSDYKFGDKSNFTKYNYSDNLTILEPIDDAATQIIGSDWRIPTKEDLQELLDNTDIYFISTDDNEIQATYLGGGDNRFTFPEAETMKGIKFYNKSDHSKYILVPACGYAREGLINLANNGAYVRSSLIYTDTNNTWNLSASASSGYGIIFHVIYGYGYRYYGTPIRAIKPQ